MAANAPVSFLFPDEEFALPIPVCFKLLVTEDLSTRLVATTSRVRKIVHLKLNTGPYHELLLVDVIYESPKGSHTTYLLIERCGQFAPRPSGSPPLRSVALNSSVSLSDGKASDVAWQPGPHTRTMYPFDDYVSLLRRRGYELLRTALVPNFMSAAQLIVMAQTVHDKKPGYRVLDGQCYWYAGMLLDMVESEFRAAIIEHIPRAGKYKFVKVTTIDPTAVKEVLEEYREAWKAFSVAEDRNDDASKKDALEQERKAWEEERQRIEAVRSAVEQERSVVGQERSAMEQERQVIEAARITREEENKKIEAARSAMEQERKALDQARKLLEEAEARGAESAKTWNAITRS